MSSPFDLLPPAICAEEARDFTHPGGAVFPLAFRVIPGPVHDTRLTDIEERLVDRFVTRGERISLIAQPPQALDQTMCQYLALLMACQVAPKAKATNEGGVTFDLTGLDWKPYNIDQWVELANRGPEIFYAAVAFCRVIEARAEGLKAPRFQIAVAYQVDHADGLNPNTMVSPGLEGLNEPDPVAASSSTPPALTPPSDARSDPGND